MINSPFPFLVLCFSLRSARARTQLLFRVGTAEKGRRCTVCVWWGVYECTEAKRLCVAHLTRKGEKWPRAASNHPTQQHAAMTAHLNTDTRSSLCCMLVVTTCDDTIHDSPSPSREQRRQWGVRAPQKKSLSLLCRSNRHTPAAPSARARRNTSANTSASTVTLVTLFTRAAAAAVF